MPRPEDDKHMGLRSSVAFRSCGGSLQLYRMSLPWMSATEAVRLVRSGDRVFIHGSAATPVRLVHALLDRHAELRDVEITAISSFGDLGFDRPEVQGPFYLNSLFVSANMRSMVAGPMATTCRSSSARSRASSRRGSCRSMWPWCTCHRPTDMDSAL